MQVGHIFDLHRYAGDQPTFTGPMRNPKNDSNLADYAADRAAVLGEYGGVKLPCVSPPSLFPLICQIQNSHVVKFKFADDSWFRCLVKRPAIRKTVADKLRCTCKRG